MFEQFEMIYLLLIVLFGIFQCATNMQLILFAV